jgi:hypothetical protein
MGGPDLIRGRHGVLFGTFAEQRPTPPEEASSGCRRTPFPKARDHYMTVDSDGATYDPHRSDRLPDPRNQLCQSPTKRNRSTGHALTGRPGLFGGPHRVGGIPLQSRGHCSQFPKDGGLVSRAAGVKHPQHPVRQFARRGGQDP